MSDLAKKLNEEIPEVSDDLETHVKDVWTTLYDMNETLLRFLQLKILNLMKKSFNGQNKKIFVVVILDS
jgi:hypothetical protein